ncbi:hypothetical protein PsYK624_126000 [Phanerochaete sordida]|uniref:Uncharacterized protein n=1 Tax=Phanerochaete sordida TaxID=48140 RepID=A0A9P3LIQ0_9APHY|nr:hypothetical protein PsYK624_126000 [Phanerochaete sordida]
MREQQSRAPARGSKRLFLHVRNRQSLKFSLWLPPSPNDDLLRTGGPGRAAGTAVAVARSPTAGPPVEPVADTGRGYRRRRCSTRRRRRGSQTARPARPNKPDALFGALNKRARGPATRRDASQGYKYPGPFAVKPQTSVLPHPTTISPPREQPVHGDASPFATAALAGVSQAVEQPFRGSRAALYGGLRRRPQRASSPPDGSAVEHTAPEGLSLEPTATADAGAPRVRPTLNSFEGGLWLVLAPERGLGRARDGAPTSVVEHRPALLCAGCSLRGSPRRVLGAGGAVWRACGDSWVDGRALCAPDGAAVVRPGPGLDGERTGGGVVRPGAPDAAPLRAVGPGLSQALLFFSYLPLVLTCLQT